MLNAYRLLTVATFGAYRFLAISFDLAMAKHQNLQFLCYRKDGCQPTFVDIQTGYD